MIDRTLRNLIFDKLDKDLSYCDQLDILCDAIEAEYDLTLKPKPIEVGCIVAINGHKSDYNVLALDEQRQYAWIKCGSFQQLIDTDVLTRID